MRTNYLINVYTIRMPLIIAIYEYYGLEVQHQCVKRYLQDNTSVANIATVLLLSVCFPFQQIITSNDTSPYSIVLFQISTSRKHRYLPSSLPYYSLT